MDVQARPLCSCHGQPMYRNGHNWNGVNGVRQRWVCSVKQNIHAAKTYDNLTGVQYNAMLLRGRRRQALERMAKRAGA